MNINVVKLSLNGNSLSWVVTCVACQLSLVACVLGFEGLLISGLSFNICLGHVSEVLAFSSFLAHGGYWQHVHPGIL